MAHWQVDGSAGFTVDGNKVTHIDESGGGNVFNALWDEGDGVTSGSHYWKIHFDSLEDGGGVGVTSKDLFKEGYACRSLSFSGNLSNGAALLVPSFGESPKAGDTVGVFASFVDDRLKVYFDVNGKCLGLTFDVPSSTINSLFPMVFFNSSGSASCHKVSEPPASTERLTTSFNGIEGDWKLKELSQGDGNSVTISTQPTTKLRKDGANEYVWITSVANNITSRLWMEDGEWKTSYNQTRMMPATSEDVEVERKLIDLVSSLKSINVDDDGNLSAKSDDLSSVWTRYDATPGPFVGEPF